jgi:hypothetical protein
VRERGPALRLASAALGLPPPKGSQRRDSCSRSQGIILLAGAQIRRICSGPTTLGEILAAGARTIQRTDMDNDELLVPHLQLRFLDWALTHDALAQP